MSINQRRPLSSAVQELRQGRVQPSSYINAVRERVKEIEPDIEAFVPEEERWERLRRQTTALESRCGEKTTKPALYGIPIAVKDIFHVDGMMTRAGSSLPAEALDGTESIAWQRLSKAGALALGKAVTTEFAYFDPGPTRNPHDTTRTPGGSSSGSAAAVAAGLCPLALGTQTIGSVIRPAAFCGTVGVKPSYGRIPTEGVIPLAPSLDHVGFFTQDLEGAQIAASVLYDEWVSVPEPAGQLTLGVPAEAYLDQAETVGRNRFENHVAALEESGHEVVRTDALDAITAIGESHERLMAAEASIVHRENEWYPDYEELYASETRELLQTGDNVEAQEIGADRAHRRDLRADLRERMDQWGIDIWVSPSAPGPAPKGIGDTGDPAMNLPWTNAGLPTVSIPVDATDSGLPLGLQCTAPFGNDEELLGWAKVIADDLGAL